MMGWLFAGVFAVISVGFSLWIRDLHAKRLEEANSTHANRLIQIRNEAEKRVGRIERASSKDLERAHHGLLRDMLPAIDALDSASKLGEDAGLVLISKKFDEALMAHGIQRISPKTNDVFDPKFHEAIETSASQSIDSGHVITAFRDGWSHEEDILRPAMVSVSSGAEISADFRDPDCDAEAVVVEE